MTGMSMLLVCADAHSLGCIREAAKWHATEVIVYSNAHQAHKALQARVFDAVVLDLDMPGTVEVLESGCKDSRGYASAVVALTRETQSVTEAAGLGIDFVLQKPLTGEAIERALNTAFALLNTEKRSTSRHSVRIPASVTVIDRGQTHIVQAAIQDISYGGLCLKVNEGFIPESSILVDFRLPDFLDNIRVRGSAVWTDTHGQVGVKFEYIRPVAFKALRAWLAAKRTQEAEFQPGLMETILTPEVQAHAGIVELR